MVVRAIKGGNILSTINARYKSESSYTYTTYYSYRLRGRRLCRRLRGPLYY